MDWMNLSYDPWGRLVYTDDTGAVHVGVEPVRAFPISQPDKGISLLDPKGKELAWIDDLASIAAEPRRLLEEELSRRHFLPALRAIRNVEGLTDPTTWHVDTDRGPATFQVKMHEDVRRIASHRIIVLDAHGVRYLIPDFRTLDAVSRRFLERFI